MKKRLFIAALACTFVISYMGVAYASVSAAEVQEASGISTEELLQKLVDGQEPLTEEELQFLIEAGIDITSYLPSAVPAEDFPENTEIQVSEENQLSLEELPEDQALLSSGDELSVEPEPQEEPESQEEPEVQYEANAQGESELLEEPVVQEVAVEQEMVIQEEIVPVVEVATAETILEENKSENDDHEMDEAEPIEETIPLEDGIEVPDVLSTELQTAPEIFETEEISLHEETYLASSEFQSGSFLYTLDATGKATITGVKPPLEIASGSRFIIPAVLDGHPVIRIGEEAFRDAGFFKNGELVDAELEISNGIEVIGEKAFYGSRIKRIYIPRSVKSFTGPELFEYVFSYISGLEAFVVDPNNPSFCSVDGVLYSKDKTILYNYPVEKGESTYTTPIETTTLACTSFARSKLQNLYLPNEKVNFKTYTFFGCDVTLFVTQSKYDEWNQRLNDGWYFSGNVKLAVIGQEITATGVSLNTTSLTMTPGETSELSATVLPSNATIKKVKWESSNTDIVTVNNEGKITAKSIGKAMVTATVIDGSNKTATCEVVVTSGVSITNTKPALKLEIENEAAISFEIELTDNYRILSAAPFYAYPEGIIYNDMNVSANNTSYQLTVKGKSIGTTVLYINVLNQAANTIEGYRIAEISVYGTPIQTCDINPNVGWKVINGKSYWYEMKGNQFVKQGIYGSSGNVWYDGSERGREIYDPCSNGWYWLDSVFNGAKAVDKEVFMPYIYSNESTFNESTIYNVANSSDTYTESDIRAVMSQQIYDAIKNKTGKWVRYDRNGMMYKGWYTVQGRDASIYPHQVGNTYYYDYKTGLMAKGKTVIAGKTYYFDPITGVLQ